MLYWLSRIRNTSTISLCLTEKGLNTRAVEHLGWWRWLESSFSGNCQGGWKKSFLKNWRLMRSNGSFAEMLQRVTQSLPITWQRWRIFFFSFWAVLWPVGAVLTAAQHPSSWMMLSSSPSTCRVQPEPRNESGVKRGVFPREAEEGRWEHPKGLIRSRCNPSLRDLG